MTELLTTPVTATTKAQILRMLPQCSSEDRQQLLDSRVQLPTLAPPPPPRPVLLLEHCGELMNVLHTNQLAVAHILEHRHVLTH